MLLNKLYDPGLLQTAALAVAPGLILLLCSAEYVLNQDGLHSIEVPLCHLNVMLMLLQMITAADMANAVSSSMYVPTAPSFVSNAVAPRYQTPTVSAG